MKVQKSFKNEEKTGLLYLVATPIGNLEDMTFRAVRILKEADWIAAEDTRQTRKLLNHYEISARLISYHEHNKHTSGRQIIDKCLAGESVALVSDAGLPGISDPGEDLVRLAVEHDIAVIPIPGANAALSALIVSALPAVPFTFVGFLPREKKKLEAALEELRITGGTVVVYEAPHRMEKTLQAMLKVWGDAPAAMIRELTKKYEEIIRGTIAECSDYLRQIPPKGEYCLVVHLGQAHGPEPSDPVWWQELSVDEHVKHYEQSGSGRMEAMKKAAADRGVSKREIYQTLISPQ